MIDSWSDTAARAGAMLSGEITGILQGRAEKLVTPSEALRRIKDAITEYNAVVFPEKVKL